MLLGILSGLAAGALWGLVFLVPKILADYTAADIALGRYIVFGALSFIYLVPRFKHLRTVMTWRMTGQALGISCLSFSVYYFALVKAIQFCGVVPTSLIIGLLPVTIALASREKIARPSLFYISTGIILVGLILLNMPLLHNVDINAISQRNWILGLGLSVFALICWTMFALTNAKFLKRHSQIDSSTWSSLLGVCALVTMIPLWLVNGGDVSISHFLDKRYILYMILIGAGSSWLATYMWNFSSRRLPTALAGQLVVSETVFSFIYNYVYEGRMPILTEIGAAMLLITGVILGIRAFKVKA